MFVKVLTKNQYALWDFKCRAKGFRSLRVLVLRALVFAKAEKSSHPITQIGLTRLLSMKQKELWDWSVRSGLLSEPDSLPMNDPNPSTSFMNNIGLILKPNLLEKEDLSWVKNDKRQLSFLKIQLLLEAKKSTSIVVSPEANSRSINDPLLRLLSSQYSLGLDEWLCFFDAFDFIHETKSAMLLRMKHNWAERQKLDREYNWYDKSGATREKCETAWNWYCENYANEMRGIIKFENKTDVLIFLDNLVDEHGKQFSEKQKLDDLAMIKNKFNYLQTQKRRKDCIQTNLSLSNEARKKLDKLAKERGVTKTKLVEGLILNA